jgi:hypothetical protein
VVHFADGEVAEEDHAAAGKARSCR